MTEETIFNQATPDPAAPNTAASASLPQELLDLVGPGKKYASEADALKSVPHAQKHIKTLEDELALVKIELEKRKTAADLLDEIKSGFQPSAQPAPGTITTDNVAQIVEQALENKNKKQLEVSNITKVTSAFTEKFGDKANDAYKLLAQESGISVQELNRLAATSPQAVFKLAGLTGKQDVSGSGKMNSSVNTEGLPRTDSTNTLSARLKAGASTKDMVNAWKIAGQKVGKST